MKKLSKKKHLRAFGSSYALPEVNQYFLQRKFKKTNNDLPIFKFCSTNS